MALNITCPACRATLRVREDLAGTQMTCPRCSASVPVGAVEPLDVEPADEAPAPPLTVEAVEEPSVPTKPCPACGKQIAYTARKCRFCRTWVEDEEDEDQLGRTYFKKCPRCGAGGAQRVVFTFWGSFYGPALFTHVRCPDCGYAYNGRTGRSNLLPAVVFVTIPLLLIVGIIVGLILILVRAMAAS
jgi:predicted RNA-binding Zn-ribbon protein involved in translation (DUF1610 family)